MAIFLPQKNDDFSHEDLTHNLSVCHNSQFAVRSSQFAVRSSQFAVRSSQFAVR
ncbi:MAG: hypothetical protein J6X78_03430 [Treponema sp.]|nr:hypothetical protein [Treponema sp.]